VLIVNWDHFDTNRRHTIFDVCLLFDVPWASYLPAIKELPTIVVQTFLFFSYVWGLMMKSTLKSISTLVKLEAIKIKSFIPQNPTKKLENEVHVLARSPTPLLIVPVELIDDPPLLVPRVRAPVGDERVQHRHQTRQLAEQCQHRVPAGRPSDASSAT
jgi:hypothetical protein